jgi:hypothetical protein
MALAYITTTDIKNLTGSELSSTILTAIGEEAERQATSYLNSRGITSISGDIVKSACLQFSHAGVILRFITEGTRTKSDGNSGTTYQDLPDSGTLQAIYAELMKNGYNLLEEYAKTQIPTGSQSAIFFKVNR